MRESQTTSWNYVSYSIAPTLVQIHCRIVGIMAIEAGLRTPPFGLLVHTVKAAIPDETDVSIAQIFKSSTPYWMVMLIGMVAIVVFPKIATFLPDLMF